MSMPACIWEAGSSCSSGPGWQWCSLGLCCPCSAAGRLCSAWVLPSSIAAVQGLIQLYPVIIICSSSSLAGRCCLPAFAAAWEGMAALALACQHLRLLLDDDCRRTGNAVSLLL